MSAASRVKAQALARALPLQYRLLSRNGNVGNCCHYAFPQGVRWKGSASSRGAGPHGVESQPAAPAFAFAFE
jgi:hypothetical protein